MSFGKGRSLGGLDGVAGVRGQGSPPPPKKNPAVLPYLASHTADKKLHG